MHRVLRLLLGSAALLALAAVSLHVTGLAKVEWVSRAAAWIGAMGLSEAAFGLLAAGAAAAILGMTLIGTLADRRIADGAEQFALARCEMIADTERKLEEQDIRIDTALNSMRQGLVMFDKHLRLVVCNERFLEMYGLPASVATSRCTITELIAMHFTSNGFPGRLDDYIADILREFAAGNQLKKVVELSDGRVVSITNSPVEGGGRISTHEDITEQRAVENTVREQRMLFDTALNNMSQGLVMFDKDLRLTVCNDRYREMYAIPEEMVRDGCTLRDLLLHHHRAGVLDGNAAVHADNILKQITAEAEVTRIIKTVDGRIFQIVNRRLDDGGRIATHEDITERHRLYEANREGEAQLRIQRGQIDAALAHMSQGLCLFDARSRIVLFNQQFLDLYGMSADVVRPGTTFVDMMRHRKAVGSMVDDPEQLAAEVLVSVSDGKARDHMMRLNDGRFIRAFNRPLPDGGWVTTYEDVTERIRSQDLLQEQKLHLDTALGHMTQGLCMFDEQTRIVLFNQRFMEIYGMSADVVKPGMTFLDMMRHRKTAGFMAEDPEEFSKIVLKSVAERKIRDHIMRLNDGRFIRAVNRPMPGGGWVTTHEDVTERFESQEALRTQKIHLDTALDNMTQGIVLFNADENLVLCNKRYLDIYAIEQKDVTAGMKLEQLLALRRSKGMFPRDPAGHAAKIKAAVSKGDALNLISSLADGRFISVHNLPMQGGGWVSTHEDITTRRNAEEQLRDQKLQLDTALDNMTQGLLMFDAQQRLVLCNQRYSQMYRLPADAVRPGMLLLDLLTLRKAHDTFRPVPQDYIAELAAKLAAGEAVNLITEMPDGRTIAVGNQPMPGGGWVSTHNDITEQRQAEELLRGQKVQLDTALNTMTQGLNLFDSDARLIISNERYRQMYRLPPDSVKPGMGIEELVRARVAAGTFFAIDAEAYVANLRQRLTEREPGTVVMELTDGRTVAMHSEPTLDGNGWVVTHEDITERRRVEAERDRSTALATSVIENVPATIIVKDARTRRYMLINKAGERYYNVTRQQMIGKTANDIFPPQTAKMVSENDAEVLKQKVPVLFDEHPSMTPGGEARIVSTIRVPILDQHGEPQYLLSVIEDRTNRKRAEARIAHLAHHDILTGLPNRAAFNACLESTLEATARERGAFVVMSLDVARLKEVNDVFGYGTGDRLLSELSRRLQMAAGGAFVARLGGDEFSIIATDGEQPQAAEQIAERVQALLSEEIVIDGKHIQSGVSVGIAIYPQNGEDATTLVANADAALHRAKTEDRGSYRFFEADMDKRLRDRRALQHDLSTAIEGGQLSLHYQPQARTDGSVFGFEALVRWKHPTRGNISPGVFIPLAEESGLIIPVGEWILREACRQAASWPKPLSIAVNLSPVQFRHGDVAALVHSVLLETGLPPQRLELEITEGVLIGDFSRALSILRRLKAMGVRIAMDDFGTGYSSLSYLQAFPFDKIKIDQAFISNLENNPQSATIVRAVIGLARGFAVPVIAEGVETQAQLNFLSSEGCDEVQGYLIGRPQPIEEYASLVGHPIPMKRKDKGISAVAS